MSKRYLSELGENFGTFQAAIRGRIRARFVRSQVEFSSSDLDELTSYGVEVAIEAYLSLRPTAQPIVEDGVVVRSAADVAMIQAAKRGASQAFWKRKQFIGPVEPVKGNPTVEPYDQSVRIVGHCPPASRRIVSMLSKGTKVQDIAADMGVTRETIRRRLVDCREPLAKQLRGLRLRECGSHEAELSTRPDCIPDTLVDEFPRIDNTPLRADVSWSADNQSTLEGINTILGSRGLRLAR